MRSSSVTPGHTNVAVPKPMAIRPRSTASHQLRVREESMCVVSFRTWKLGDENPNDAYPVRGRWLGEFDLRGGWIRSARFQQIVRPASATRPVGASAER